LAISNFGFFHRFATLMPIDVQEKGLFISLFVDGFNSFFNFKKAKQSVVVVVALGHSQPARNKRSATKSRCSSDQAVLRPTSVLLQVENNGSKYGGPFSRRQGGRR
jgi:hypothetical protein